MGHVRQAHHGRGEPPIVPSLRPASPAAEGVHGRAGTGTAPVSRADAALGLSPKAPGPIPIRFAAPRGCPSSPLGEPPTRAFREGSPWLFQGNPAGAGAPFLRSENNHSRKRSCRAGRAGKGNS